MMKKQLLFCSLALASSMTAFANVGDPVTNLSQLDNEKVYSIRCVESKRGTWSYDASNPNILNSTTRTGTDVDLANRDQQFAFLTSASGKHYIYSVGGDKFFARGDNRVSLIERPESSTSYVTFLNSTYGNSEYPFVVTLEGYPLNLCNPGSTDPRGVVFYLNPQNQHTEDGGNSIQIVEAGTFAKSAEVMAKIEEFEKAYTEENIANAEALNTEVSGFLSVPQYAVGGYNPQLWQNLYEACGGDGVVDIYDYANHATDIKNCITALKESSPTEFSNEKVYKIQNYVSVNGYIYAKDGDERIFSSTKNSSLATVPNSDKWQLHEEDGKYYLYNQGTQKYAEYNGSAWDFTPIPTMVNVEQNTNKGVALFWIQDATHTGQYEYMHVNNGSYENGVVGWETVADASNFYFVEVPDAEVVALANLALTREKMLAEEIINGTKENYVGRYSATTIESLRKVVEDQDATIQSIKKALDEANNSSDRLSVQSDKYYFILNAMQFNDGSVKAIYENPDGTNVAWHTTEGTAAELWQLESAGDDLYYLKSVNTGKCIYKPMGQAGAATMEEEGTTFSLSEQSYCSFGLEHVESNDKVTLALSNAEEWGNYPNPGSKGSGNYLQTYNAYGEDIPTQWNIVEATSVNLTIGSTGYATAYFPFAVTIPEGVKAYTVSAAAGGVATLSPLTGTIPANTGVILSGDAKTYPFAITTSTVSKVEGNMLDGVTMATDLDPETSYILADGTNGLGFYKVDSNDKTLAANKAYLVVSNAADASYSLKLDGAVTGIQSVENAAENAPAYDLQGRRLPQVPTKGLYIQNGKKIMK